MNKPLGATIYKTAKVSKAPTDGSGYFEGYLSTWDVDRDGERFARGAYTQSIMEWTLSEDMPPVLLNHERSPDSILGRVEWMVEDETGLKIGGQLDLTNEKSQSAYEALLTGRLNTLSVSFIGYEWDFEGDVKVWTRAEILEASLTPVPSNTAARVTAVKSDNPDRRVAVNFGGEVVEVDPEIAKWIAEDRREPVNAKAATDVAYWNSKIADAAAGKNVERPPVDVDRFVTEVRQEMVEETLAKSRQAVWQGRMFDDARGMAEIAPEDERERDLERRERERREMVDRAHVEYLAVEQENAADEARREAAREDGNIYAW